MSSDEKWMQRALALAQKGCGRVHPNPMVGAVLVRRGHVVGEGYHRRYGGPHAEIEALKKAGSRARGSTLYVTLEPCSHWGKTPPCADAVVRAGVSRVVSAMRDPNPLVAGRGYRRLKHHGLSVVSDVLREEASHLNRSFLFWVRTRRPYVTVKVASSLDGRTCTSTGESKWITSTASRRAGHRLRAEVDAIAIGANTVRADNPHLTAHGQGRNPTRILFAGRQALPRRLHIFNRDAKTVVLKNQRSPKQLKESLQQLGSQGVTHLLVEGGQSLQASFWNAGLVNEVIWFVAPIIIGTHKRLAEAWRLRGLEDVCFRGEVA